MENLDKILKVEFLLLEFSMAEGSILSESIFYRSNPYDLYNLILINTRVLYQQEWGH